MNGYALYAPLRLQGLYNLLQRFVGASIFIGMQDSNVILKYFATAL